MFCAVLVDVTINLAFRLSRYRVQNGPGFQCETSDSARRSELDAAPNQEDELSLGQADLISLAETLSTAE